MNFKYYRRRGLDYCDSEQDSWCVLVNPVKELRFTLRSDTIDFSRRTSPWCYIKVNSYMNTPRRPRRGVELLFP